jgi:hypothetical protein
VTGSSSAPATGAGSNKENGTWNEVFDPGVSYRIAEILTPTTNDDQADVTF